MRHYEYYLACANLGDRLIVRVVENTNKDPRGSVIPFDQRTHTLAHIPYVDLICGMQEGGGLKWVEQFRPSIIVKSTTSGVKVVREIQEVNSLDYIPEIVIMDDRCNIVPIDQAEEKGLEYDNTKFRADRVSGSVHKQTIINRYIDDNRDNLQCDLTNTLP
jgi:glycerol-3-phosphate cytidylyltransferase-like family protein